MRNNKKRSGFTLVELAVVLTIISLIVGGIVGGERLVDNYKLASVISHFEKYKVAYDEFQKQYMAVPGDMTDASDAFQGYGGYSAASNGNGNSRIEYSGSDSEQFKAWQHLSRAQLINGNYTGQGNNNTYTSGTNVPTGPHEAGVFRMLYEDNDSYLGGLNRDVNYLLYSRAKPGCSSNCERVGILSAADALSIDRKIDDGVPNAGRVVGANSLNDYGVAQSCLTGSSYWPTNKGKNCIVYYSLEY